MSLLGMTVIGFVFPITLAQEEHFPWVALCGYGSSQNRQDSEANKNKALAGKLFFQVGMKNLETRAGPETEAAKVIPLHPDIP